MTNTLDLSQSTVSRRILLLERRLGVALFERRKTGISLTPAGRRFIDEAAVGVERLTTTIYELRQARNGRSRRSAPDGHKHMIIESNATDILFSASIDGAPANWLTKSLLAAGSFAF